MTPRPRKQKSGATKSPPPIIKSFTLPDGESLKWVPSELMVTNQWALYDKEGVLLRHVMYYEYSIINCLMDKIEKLSVAKPNPEIKVSIS